MARVSNVSLGKNAEFDKFAQSASTREDIDHLVLNTLGCIALKHFNTKEKVKYLEVAAPLFPKRKTSTNMLC